MLVVQGVVNYLPVAAGPYKSRGTQYPQLMGYGALSHSQKLRYIHYAHLVFKQRAEYAYSRAVPENLKKFVQETRLRGGIPVLFNSVVRRNFANSQTAVEDDDKRDNSSKNLAEGNTLVDTHGDYLLSPRNVARLMEVPFIDANKITHDLEQGLGPEGSKKLHVWYKPGEIASLPEGRQDNTHYNIYGAYTVAGLLADAIAEQVPALKDYVRHYDIVVAKDGSGLYFDLQQAVDNAPAGKEITILVCAGDWQKPVIPKGKKIKFIMREGAKWIK